MNRETLSTPPWQNLAKALAGPALLGLVLLAVGPAPSEAGILVPSGSKKSNGSFESGGHKVTVWCYEPKTKGKHPALVMLYGMDCLSESPKRYEFVAQRLAGKGYAVYFVHYFDCTKVEKKDVAGLQTRLKDSLTPKAEAVADEQVQRYFQDWMAAVKGGVLFARGRENVDPERVGLVGFSLGGYVAMSVLATEPDLNLAAAVEFFGGLPKDLHAGLKSAPPVLIFHGDKDDIVPVKEALVLKALLKEKMCHVEDKIFDGVGHMFLGDNGVLRLDRVLEAERICVTFLDRHLKNGRKKKAP